jgi:hypothetical protein
MRDIALLGKARSGKDSVAEVLTEEFGYRRLAFADELKEAALRTDPIISWIPNFYTDGSGEPIRLNELIADDGWERVKDEYPEVRRFLQHLGHAMRQVDPEVWIWPVIEHIERCYEADRRIVITDCRYRNEADTLRRNGFLLVRVVRPGAGGDQHVSETELDDYPVDFTLKNTGSLEDLREAARMLGA